MPHPVAWESRFVGQGTTEEVSVHVKMSAMNARLCLSYIAIDIALYQWDKVCGSECHLSLYPSTSNPQLLTAILHIFEGSQWLQAQSFGKSGCIDRPRNRIDAGSAVLVFRAPNHS